jgi:beta-glucosidase-like glycosyl hydrolase/CubicO group peptidase (beta-lactamase class C family)
MFTKTLAIFLKSYSGLLIWLSVSIPTSISVQVPSASYRAFSKQEIWVDSVFNSLNNRQRLAQLFMIRAHSNLDEKHNASVEKLIRDYQVGGICFFQGGPYRQAKLNNRYQKISKIPLLISIDGEWGLGMRLDSTISFPRQMTLGAIDSKKSDSLIYEMGKEIGRECLRMGIHINFAPTVDININPDNPVIGDRSFGEDKINVAQKGIAYMRGMQAVGLMASGKHFPGHGDTNVDSHYGVPVINHTKERMNDIELYPFRQLIANNIESMLVGHLQINAYDQLQSSLSPKIIAELLQKDLNFKGLVFTDALEMKGLTNYHAPGELETKVLLAGNDVLLLSGNVGIAINAIEQAITQKRMTWEYIHEKVKRVLRVKYQKGLHKPQLVDTKNLSKDLNTPYAYQLQETLFQKAITLVKNEQNIVPINRIDSNSFASLAIYAKNPVLKNTFQDYLDNYADFEHFRLPSSAMATQTAEYETLLNKLSQKKTVLVSLHGVGKNKTTNYNINHFDLAFLRRLAQKTQVIITTFGSPYSLKVLGDFKNLICAYEDNMATQKLVPQIIFGALPAEGKLPVSINQEIPLYTGLITKPIGRLRFGFPEEMGFIQDSLKTMDKIIQKAMKDHAIPGSQLLIARKGKVVWNKAYGNFTYSHKSAPVTQNSIYDVASISKVAGTLQTIMYLYDRGKLDLDKRAADYLPELEGTNKDKMTIREILTHQAGLVPYIKYWEKTLLGKKLNPAYYSQVKSEKYPLKVADNVYTLKSIEDSLWKWTVESDIAKSKDSSTNLQYYKYVYSDLSFYMLKRIAEKLLNEPMEDFLLRELYRPLGLRNTAYNPLDKFAKTQIAPTEKDTYFREQLLQGYVHDQGAGLLGGVGGHAGLFSNAKDLAVLMQMLLQRGTYGNTIFYKPETVDLFTRQQYPKNRRGLGWDKADSVAISYIPLESSKDGFGHSGFTGCVVWADPQLDLVMVFLSNRVYPSAENDKLVKNHIRRKVFDVVYRALKK